MQLAKNGAHVHIPQIACTVGAADLVYWSCRYKEAAIVVNTQIWPKFAFAILTRPLPEDTRGTLNVTIGVVYFLWLSAICSEEHKHFHTHQTSGEEMKLDDQWLQVVELRAGKKI